MATKKKPAKKTTTTTRTTVENPELTEDQREELDPFERAKLEFEGVSEVKLAIYRYDDGRAAYLKQVDYDAETVSPEFIRRKWGAGSYQLRFSHTGSNVRWSKVIEIAPDRNLETPATASSSSGPSATEALFLAALQKQNEIMLQGLLNRSGGGGSGGGGNEALVALIQGIQSQNAELLKSSLNRPDTSSTLLTVLERGMAIAAEAKLDSEGGWVAQLGRIAKDVLPVVQEMAKARPMHPPPNTVGVAGMGSTRQLNPGDTSQDGQGAGGGMVDTNPSGAKPADSAGPPPAQASSSPELDVEQLIRDYAPAILEAIQSGAQASTVADSILGVIPPVYYPEFDKLSTERVLELDPRFSSHRDYITKLVASLQDTGDGDGD